MDVFPENYTNYYITDSICKEKSYAFEKLIGYCYRRGKRGKRGERKKYKRRKQKKKRRNRRGRKKISFKNQKNILIM